MKDVPDLLELVKEALPQVVAHGPSPRLEIEFGRAIGIQDCVETTEADDIFYAKRPNRDRYSRFVRGHEPSPATTIVLRMDKTGDNEYDIFTTYIGRLTPPFPFGDGRDSTETIEFWKDHALVIGAQELVPGTETKDCPWANFR